MRDAIREFLLAGENIDTFLMVAAIFLIGAVASVLAIFFQRRKFILAWNEILDAVADDLNNKGVEMIESLIAIAMISADKDAALIIGMAKKDFEDSRNDSQFYRKLAPMIAVINDNNHTANLNSSYASVRDSVKEATELIEKFSQIGSFEAFSLLSIKANQIREKISLAAKNLQGVLYSLNPQQTIVVKKE